MAYPYYPGPTYPSAYPYTPPMPDQLSQLKQGQFQNQNQPMMGNQPGFQANSFQPNAVPPKLYDFVQGEAGAKGYLVAAGNTMLLLDSEAQTFYLKTSDASGVPMPLRIFDYTERPTNAPKTAPVGVQVPNEEYVTRREFEAVVASLRAEERRDTPAAQSKSVNKKTGKEKEDADHE